jgi:hypothetical protein
MTRHKQSAAAAGALDSAAIKAFCEAALPAYDDLQKAVGLHVAQPFYLLCKGLAEQDEARDRLVEGINERLANPQAAPEGEEET